MLDITQPSQFQQMLEKYPVVVLDIYADWCSPCKMIAPKLEALAKQYEQYGVGFVKCNVENKIFQAKGLPTIEFWVKGQKAQTVLGADMKKIKEILQTVIPNVIPQDAVAEEVKTVTGDYALKGSAKSKGGYKTYKDM